VLRAAGLRACGFTCVWQGLRRDTNTKPQKNQQQDANALCQGKSFYTSSSHYTNYTHSLARPGIFYFRVPDACVEFNVGIKKFFKWRMLYPVAGIQTMIRNHPVCGSEDET
jgi:hypothetical protein